MELVELQQHIQEDQQIDHERQQLQTQVREAQQLQDEAIRAQESLTRRLERQRQLNKRAKELEIAKMITSLLKEKMQVPDGARSSPCLTDHRKVSNPVFSPSETLAPTPVNVAPPPESGLVSRESSSTSCAFCPAFRKSDFASSAPYSPASCGPGTASSDCSCSYSDGDRSSRPPRNTTFTPLSSSSCAVSISPSTATVCPFFRTLALYLCTLELQPSLYAIFSSSAFNYPVQATMCSTSALPPSSPQQPQAADISPFIATSYGIPKPMIPCFESGKENDFALLKMALDNLLNSHLHLNEQYKYQVLLGHLKLPSVLQLAKANMHDLRPYTTAMQALQDKYGQPRQLVQSELGAILNAPALKFGGAEAFYAFALSIQSLVGMLRTLEGQNGYELRCGPHVDQLLSKMPPSYRDGFLE